MSFSKAKINRYYDEISCAPPPGKYDPKDVKKGKAPVFDKGTRFTTPKIERTSSVESIDSCSSSSSKTSLFKTPSKRIGKKTICSTTPRKNNLSGKIVLPDKINPTKITEPDKHLVEEIKELTRLHQNQLIEKNEQVASLIQQINSLNNKIANLLKGRDSNEYDKEIDKLKNQLADLQAFLSANEKNYKNHIEDLNCQISNLEENIQNHITINKHLDKSLNENSNIYYEINQRIGEMAADFNFQLDQYKVSLDKVENLNKYLFEDYHIMLDILKKESEENIIDKETISELRETIDNCKDELSYTLKRCRIYQVVQTETSKTVEVLSRRLTESELEVDRLTDVQIDLLSKKINLEEQVKSLSLENQLIRDSLDNLQQSVRLEIETMQNSLVQKVDTYKQFAIEQSEKQKFCLEEKQKTIEMLLAEITFYKNKKIEDNFHIASCQSKMINYQEKINILKTELTDLEQDFQEKISAQKALFSRLSDQYESLKKLSTKEKSQLEKKISNLHKEKTKFENSCTEKDNEITYLQVEVQNTNSLLSRSQTKIKRLEQLTNQYNDDLIKITKQLEEKNNIIKTMKKLNEQSKDSDHEKLNKMLKEQDEIIQLMEYEKMVEALNQEQNEKQKENLFEIIERQNREIEALSQTADRHYSARRDLEQQINNLNQEKQRLQQIGKQDLIRVTTLEEALADVEGRNRQLTDLIGPFKNQLMEFETERNLFLSKSDKSKEELTSLEKEQTQLLGHHDLQQKMKHIDNLNHNITTLNKEMEKLKLENMKLKQELSAKKPTSLGNTKNIKENNSRVQSKEHNNSPSSVLKHKN